MPDQPRKENVARSTPPENRFLTAAPAPRSPSSLTARLRYEETFPQNPKPNTGLLGEHRRIDEAQRRHPAEKSSAAIGPFSRVEFLGEAERGLHRVNGLPPTVS